MKLSYSMEYLERKHGAAGAHSWIVERARWLGDQTGVEWCADYAAGRVCWDVLINYRHTEPISDPGMVRSVAFAMRELRPDPHSYRTISWIKDRAPMGLSYAEVVGVVCNLIGDGLLLPGIGRHGRAITVRPTNDFRSILQIGQPNP